MIDAYAEMIDAYAGSIDEPTDIYSILPDSVYASVYL